MLENKIPEALPLDLSAFEKKEPEVICSALQMTDIKQKQQIQVFIEEDILVPDIKPDMKDIVLIDGRVRISEKGTDAGSLRVIGDLVLDILYAPEGDRGSEQYPLVPMEAKINFKNDSENSGYSQDLEIMPVVEHVDYTIVNERKFKIKALVVFAVKEYNQIEEQLFEGVVNDEVQLLKKKIKYTDMAEKRMERTEIKEEIELREGSPEIGKVLRSGVNIIENHRQIARDKAVINATAAYNILYMSNEERPKPVFYQGKSEFTQFIKLSDTENIPGSRVSFRVSNLNVAPKAKEEEDGSVLAIEMDVETTIEIYKNYEKEIITDVYHHIKDVELESNDVKFMYLQGNGSTDINLRETVTVPNAEQIAYMEGRIYETGSSLDTGKNILEGVLEVGIVGVEGDNSGLADERISEMSNNEKIFKVKAEVPFRSFIEIPGITKEMTGENEFYVKELSFEKLNNRQIEINAVVSTKTMITKTEVHTLIKSVKLIEPEINPGDEAGIVLYIAKKGDSIWKIAKKYRTTIDEICRINQMEQEEELKSGEKILIVRRMQ